MVEVGPGGVTIYIYIHVYEKGGIIGQYEYEPLLPALGRGWDGSYSCHPCLRFFTCISRFLQRPSKPQKKTVNPNFLQWPSSFPTGWARYLCPLVSGLVCVSPKALHSFIPWLIPRQAPSRKPYKQPQNPCDPQTANISASRKPDFPKL